MKYSVAFLIPVLLAETFCLSCSKEETEPLAGESYTQYVDPLIGSGGHGHVFVGANVPFGMVQAGPVQYNQGWDWCSGYHYSDSTVIGFAQMHLSGTGIGDLGDISFMPVVTPVQTTREGLCAKFLHKNEHVRPGYYSVLLEGSGIKAELTATARVAFHRYTYPSAAGNRSVGVVIDLEHGIGWDAPQKGHLAKAGDRMISGYRKSKGWAKEQAVFFNAEFSVPFTRVEWFNGTQRMKGDEISAEKAYATVWFDLPPGGVVMVKVGLSPVSEEKAAANLSKELPGWDFEAVVAAADSTWNNELSKIIYETIDPTRKQLFYTALYHTMTAPSVFCDYVLILTMFMACAFAAYAEMGVQVIGGPQAETEPVSLDDIQLGVEAEIDGYGVLLPSSFEFANFLLVYMQGKNNKETVYDSGNDAEFALLKIDITNTATKAREFLSKCEVKIIYDDVYEYLGWTYQQNYNNITWKIYNDPYTAYSEKQNVLYGIDKADNYSIDPMYQGHYIFGCTLPNAVVNSKKSLRMVVTMDGSEITYNIRK